MINRDDTQVVKDLIVIPCGFEIKSVKEIWLKEQYAEKRYYRILIWDKILKAYRCFIFDPCMLRSRSEVEYDISNPQTEKVKAVSIAPFLDYDLYN